jgi:hypothetical protein
MGSIGLLATAIAPKALKCPGFPEHLCVPLGLVMMQVQATNTVKKPRDDSSTRRTRSTRAANRRTRKNHQRKR